MLSIGKLEALTRAGFAARGIMYVMIGYIALRTGRAENGTEVLSYFQEGAGKALLAVMAFGFFGYGIWRLTEAVIDTEGHGDDAKGYAVRTGGFVSGLIHLGLGFYSLKLATSSVPAGSGDGGAERSAQATLQFPGGGLLLTIAAAAVLITGLYQLVKAYKAGFLDHLLPRAAMAPWVEWLGRGGYAARGIVLVIMAWLLWRAAEARDASRAGDMGEALATLPDTLQLIVAAGLLLFGLFSFVEAIYRRINSPHVIERLKSQIPAPR
jgi:hypothetical protein